MKKLLLIALISVALSGCVTLTASRYDPALMAMSVNLKHEMMLHGELCNTANSELYTQIDKLHADMLVTYTQYGAADLNPIAVELDKILDELDKSYQKGTPSQLYCATKYKLADATVTDLIKVIGKKPR